VTIDPTLSDVGRRRRRRRPSLRLYLAGLLVLFLVAASITTAYDRSRSLADARRVAGERLAFAAGLAAEDLEEAVDAMQSQVAQLAANPAIPTIFTNPAGCTLSFAGAGPFKDGHLDIVDRDGSVLIGGAADFACVCRRRLAEPGLRRRCGRGTGRGHGDR
jgi:hypothetical protein